MKVVAELQWSRTDVCGLHHVRAVPPRRANEVTSGSSAEVQRSGADGCGRHHVRALPRRRAKEVASGSSAEVQRADLSGVHHPCASSRRSMHVVTRCAHSVPFFGGAR